MDTYSQCIVMVQGYTLAGIVNIGVEWPVIIDFTVKQSA
jgi:hypothetical protein